MPAVGANTIAPMYKLYRIKHNMKTVRTDMYNIHTWVSSNRY